MQQKSQSKQPSVRLKPLPQKNRRKQTWIHGNVKQVRQSKNVRMTPKPNRLKSPRPAAKRHSSNAVHALVQSANKTSTTRFRLCVNLYHVICMRKRLGMVTTKLVMPKTSTGTKTSFCSTPPEPQPIHMYNETSSCTKGKMVRWCGKLGQIPTTPPLVKHSQASLTRS